MTDRVEFYEKGGGRLGVVESPIVPPVNSLVSIRGETWRVVAVTYALDHSDGPVSERVMRANVDVVPR